MQNIKTIQTSSLYYPYGGAQKRTKQVTSSCIVSLVRTCFVFFAFDSADSMGLLQKLVHCPRYSSQSPTAALLARLKYEVSGIDSLPAGFLYQFRFCIVLWSCNQVMSWHSAPSCTSAPSHTTVFRTPVWWQAYKNSFVFTLVCKNITSRVNLINYKYKHIP
jgi:hypothetical protein